MNLNHLTLRELADMFGGVYQEMLDRQAREHRRQRELEDDFWRMMDEAR